MMWVCVAALKKIHFSKQAGFIMLDRNTVSTEKACSVFYPCRHRQIINTE